MPNDPTVPQTTGFYAEADDRIGALDPPPEYRTKAEVDAWTRGVLDAQEVIRLMCEERGDVAKVAIPPVPVEKIEMLDWSSGYAEDAEPVWRIKLGGYCADFATEQGARNFAAQIESLIASAYQEGRHGERS